MFLHNCKIISYNHIKYHAHLRCHVTRIVLLNHITYVSHRMSRKMFLRDMTWKMCHKQQYVYYRTGQWYKWKQISSTNWKQICHFYYILLRNIANVIYYSKMLLICMSLHISRNNTCTYHFTSHTTYDPFQIHDVTWHVDIIWNVHELKDLWCVYLECWLE